MAIEDKNEVIYNQYDFEINRIYRVRGAVVLDTNKGQKIMREYQMSEGKANLVNCIMRHLRNYGFRNVDMICENKEGCLISQNQYGNRYVIRDYFPGEECALKSEQDMLMAAHNLARIHTILHGVDFSILKQQGQQDAEFSDGADRGYFAEGNERNIIVPQKDLRQQLINHAKEIKRVQRYICDKKKKNDFEVEFLNLYSEFRQQPERALEQIEKCDYEEFFDRTVKDVRVFHGEYTQHNITFYKKEKLSCPCETPLMRAASIDDGRDCAVTGFDKAGIGIQIYDLYRFLRKAMEKNLWDWKVGKGIIDSYIDGRNSCGECVEECELNILYSLLLFPDKLWKITDYYYNKRKTWISVRMLDKLDKLKIQEDYRCNFLNIFKNEYIYN